VTSVAGRTGAVTLSDTDISGLGTLATQSGTFSGTSSGTNTGDQDLSGKQDTLVSATNIKTINSTSLLGSGDVVVSASPAGSSGQMQFNNAGSFGGTVAVVYVGSGTHVEITAQAAATIPFAVRAAAAQSASLTEWRNSAGTVKSLIDADGSLDVNSTYTTSGYPLRVRNTGFFNAYFQGTSANTQVSFYLENNRGAFGSYGGFLYGGSACVLSSIFGQARADRLFMFSDGASNLGMTVGTLSNTDLSIGTNNTIKMTVKAGGNVGIGTASPGSQIQINAGAAGTIVTIIKAATAQSANLSEWQTSASVVHGTVSENGYFTTRKVSAPADAELSASEVAYWFDDTNGAAKFKIKGKSANGTVVTGEVSLS